MLSSALKPSLVEWKRIKTEEFRAGGMDLETFLGGMETRLGDGAQDIDLPLKPSLVEWKLLPLFLFWGRLFLETFLGGMETGIPPSQSS